MYLGTGCLWERWMSRPGSVLDFYSLTVLGKTISRSPIRGYLAVPEPRGADPVLLSLPCTWKWWHPTLASPGTV